jgi:RHS repeat-associated protein
LKNGSTIEAAASYQYSPTTGRLENVGNGTDTFTYAYTTNSNLLASVTKSGTPTIQTTHTWEANRKVLDVKENKVGSTVISSYDYSVNALGQRTAVDTAGTAFAAGERDRTWSYDALGQVTAESDANNTAYHRGFSYDAIGNRLASIEGNTDPTQPGATTYTPTALNQYSQISVPSVPSVVPTYDADGNQLASQIRPLGASSLESCLFVWDGENRLIEIKDAAGTTTLASYAYDSQSRRIARTVGTTSLVTLYDGWNPVIDFATLDFSTFDLQTVNLWGLDLSGTMQGAGGVGGLLSVTSSAGGFYPTYDGNGNVSEYLDGSGAVAAHYEYDAFGNVVFSSGASAASFRHRFSTKPQDEESGLYYYGYRYYDPVTGRWPSRDPIGEDGGLNIYGFVGNESVNQWDVLGLKVRKCIVMADRPVGGTAGAFNHYAIEKWKCCPDKYEEVRIESWTQNNPESKPLDKLELLNTKGYTAEHLKIVWKRRKIGLSVIFRGFQGAQSVKMANVFDEGDGDVDQKWSEIQGKSARYEYAEQASGEGPPDPLKNFPASVYRPTENNSNTYVREMMSRTSIPPFELSGSHPGKMQASPSGTDNWYRNPKPDLN